MEMIRKGKSIRCANVLMYIYSVFHFYDTKWKYDVFHMLNLILLGKLVTCSCFEDYRLNALYVNDGITKLLCTFTFICILYVIFHWTTNARV